MKKDQDRKIERFIGKDTVGRPLLIFGLSRIYMGALMAFFAKFFTVDFTGRTNLTKPDYWTVATPHDGDWYRTIAEYGYPRYLTTYPDGMVEKSEWAFYPLWPMMCRLVSELTNLPFYIVAHLLTLALGATATVVLYKLLRSLGVSERFTLWSICFLLFSPMGVVFSLAYTEALALLLITVILFLVHKNQLALACLPILLLSLTRPIGLSVVFFLTIYFISKWRARKITSFSISERWRLIGVTVFSGVTFALWPGLLAVKFSRWDAYLYLQTSWRDHYSESMGLWLITSAGSNILLAFGLLAGIGLFLRSVLQKDQSETNKRAWPVLLQTWALSYLIFMMLTVPAGAGIDGNLDNGLTIFPSTFRYSILLLIPLLPLITPRKNRPKSFAALVVLGMLVTFLLTAAYLRYFVVMEPPTYRLWP